MVVNNAEASADRRFPGAAEELLPDAFRRIRGVGDSKPRPEVLVVPRPIRPAAICRAGEVEGESWRDGLAASHGRRAVVHEIAEADVGRYLGAVGFVGRLEQGVTQTGGDGQIRFPTPDVLEIPVGLPGAEIAVNEC